MRPGAHSGDYVFNTGDKFARFESSCIIHIYYWFCNPMVISFSLLLHTRDYFTYKHIKTVYTHRLTHELAQLFVDFLNYMYLRELIGSGK
ncbi:hypothetical protein HanRHA438_Chr01g0033131 [Helianthus annuus]|nr:hypothetical protein HanRHA438_Chr01g0033131 [Helianthus annuus]